MRLAERTSERWVMQLSGSVKANFKTLQTASKAGRLALLDWQDAKTGEAVPVIVALNADGREYEFVPLAKMFVGNPYEELKPPNPDGGYHQ
jgi:hypothetical protein